jgi:outer membrane receptor for ferrienterochelin and colicins
MTVLLARRWAPLLVGAALSAPAAHAQSVEPGPASDPPPAATPSPNSQRIEVTGARASDGEQRRQSTAAKIVIGRDEIERFGDSNTLEVLKRLPGITIPGAPGRGGNPRLRGMGGGFTQILVDGERIAPGFALDSIPPDQIERIEILRAPTAETGARAIAGTINIVLREGFRRKVNDVNVDLQHEAGRPSAGLSWTRNDVVTNDWVLNTSLSLLRRDSVNQSRSQRRDVDRTSGDTVLERDGRSRGVVERQSLHASARLQWRGHDGQSLLLSPLLIANQSDSRTRSTLTNAPLDYARADTDGDSRFVLQRLQLNYNHRLGGGPRMEWRASLGNGQWRTRSQRRELDDGGALLRSVDDRSDNRDRNALLGLKASLLAGDGHQLVSGIELERNRRVDERTTLIDGVPQLVEFGDALQARVRRAALYAQDEWSLSPQWALHAGLRSERIATEGQAALGRIDVNRSQVTTPLLHAVWKFDPASRDQLRASLTRSYRSPSLGQLIGRPSVNLTDPAPGPNSELTADSAGNPVLRPELAIGIDLAVERHLADGGVLSANLFHRRITDLIRNVVALEEVSWSPDQPRYVSRPYNIGNATTQGLELEAKFRLDQWLADGPRTDIRANASLFRSRVDAVPGPDNRLAEQPGGTLNLGADHRLRAPPWQRLTLGGNVNYTPGYRTRLDADRWIVQSKKNVLDAYALWTFDPAVKLRLSLSNALAPDTSATTIVEDATMTETNRTTTRSFINTQLRLELKL